jgi:tRNA (guanosine-2'-O-)-methyltransferase
MSEGLYTVLSEHLTPRKRELFDSIASLRTRHLTLVLEDVYQAQNSSAVLRSMESWGIQDIYAIENSNTFLMHRRIAKGAFDWLTVHRFHEHKNNTLACMADLKSKGYKVVATALHENAIPLEELDITQKTAIVMGTELSGVSDAILEQADENVVIPMHGFTESLNVSVAASVIMQHLSNKLRKSNIPWQLSEEEQLELKIEWAKQSIHWSKHLVEMYENGEI